MTTTTAAPQGSWTKHNGAWAVQFDLTAEIAAGTTVEVVNRAGETKTVTIGAPAGATKWGKVFTIAQTPTVPEGYYVKDDDVYKVRVSKAGNTYATVLTKITTDSGAVKGKWEYAAGTIRNLTADDAITIEQAAKYGNLHGFCAICGKTLTDPASVQRGIGPVCAQGLVA
jgi:hypothetical protein